MNLHLTTILGAGDKVTYKDEWNICTEKTVFIKKAGEYVLFHRFSGPNGKIVISRNKDKQMLTNVNHFTKILRTAYSCRTLQHIQVTREWAEKAYKGCKLTEIEIGSITDVLDDMSYEICGNIGHI